MWFIILIALAAVGAVGFVIWRANFATGGTQASGHSGGSGSVPLTLRGNEPRIEVMQPGGVFSLRGFGENLDDLDVVVQARHEYDEDGFRWFELEGETGGRTVWLTVETDDETELSVTLEKLKLAELGLSSSDLDRFNDDDEGGFDFRGSRYEYEDSGEATFHRNGDRAHGERFRYWEFEADDGRSSITVETWSDGTTECHVSQPLRESQLSIFTTMGEG